MIFIDKMKNFKIYKTKTFLPTLKEDKKKQSAILLMTPNFESSKKLMNSNMFVNNNRFISYYLEKDVSYYINSKVVEELEESSIIERNNELEFCMESKRSELDDSEFGLPSKKKYPLDTEKHVRSAIKFFNYVEPEDEEELADNIIKAIKKFNINDIKYSEPNRFFKYYKEAIMEYNDVIKESYDRENDILVEEFLRNLPEDTMNLGDKVLFFNEATNPNDTRMKKLLYLSRIRYRKELLLLLDKVKAEVPWIKYTFPEIKRYMKKNIFMDLYYYNAIFFENNTWVLKKGLNLYLDLVQRLLNHPVIKEGGYTKKTIFIPVTDWDFAKDGMIWNYRKNINPISCIYQLMYESDGTRLKNIFGNVDVVFVAQDKYFKVNFSTIDKTEIKKLAIKFRIFVTKICKGEEFDAEDVDNSSDVSEDPEVIKAKIVDKIENSKGIDLTKKVANATTVYKKNYVDQKKINRANVLNYPISEPMSDDLKKNISISSKKIDSSNVSLKVDDTLTYQDRETVNKIKSNKFENDLLDEIPDEDEDYDDRTNQELDDLSYAIAKAGETNDNEEDALADLDTNQDVKDILISLGGDGDVVISDARATRMSELEKQVLDKEINGRTVKEIIESETNKEPVLTTVDVASPNKEEWSNLSYMNFDKKYDIEKDIISIFKHFENCVRPIVIRNISVTDNSTSEDRIALYDVEMEDYRGKRYRIKLDIPIMEDNRFLLRGNFKSIQTQFFNMPIIKTDLDACQLISNYQKLFLYRVRDFDGKSLPIVSKFVKAAKKYTGRKIKFTYSDNTNVCSKYNLPIDYIDMASIFNTIETDKFIIYFNQNEIREKYAIEENKGIPFAFNKELNAIEYLNYKSSGTFIHILCENILENYPDFKEIFDSVTRASASAYTQASIMSTRMPLVLLVGYYVGLTNVMDRAKILYTIEPKLTAEIKNNIDVDWIKFSDGYIVYKVTYESALLMNGLKNCSTDLYSISDIDSKNMYIEFFDDYGGRIKSDGFDNFYDLFVDPMIKESLKHYHFPTDFVDILLYGNGLLADNKYIKHTDTSSRKMRRYELIAVYAYKVLSAAYGLYANSLKHSRQAAEFSVKQTAVIDEFLKDSITSDDSCINALRDVETTNSITTKGPSGLNNDRGYSLDKRTYDDSMINVLGMSTGFAGNVGVTRQTTIDANTTPDGYVVQDDSEMNDAKSLTATESMIPFGSTHDDPMRTAMSFVQTAKHSVRIEDSDPLLVTSGADEVMPYLTTDKFAYKAKNKGKILEINENYILVEYIDGTKDYINLKETIEKNSDGGYFVPLKLDATEGLKVGSRFDENTILAYDKYSFSNKLGESNNIAYNIGKLAKVAILNTDEGFEDSGIISASMARKLATRVDIQYSAVIEKDSTIFNIAKVGDHIEASDPLLIWQDPFEDEDSAEVIAGLTSMGELSDLGKRKLLSEVTGTLKGIKMFRTVELEQLSPSLRKIVSEYEKPYKEQLEILKSNGISVSKAPACYKLNPTGKLKKAQEAVYIEFYVEYMDTLGVGDKIVYNAANKAVEKGIFPEGEEPYTEFRPNEKIDAFVSDTSISKRLVTSIPLYGSLQKLMIELDRSVKDIMGIEYDDTTI